MPNGSLWQDVSNLADLSDFLHRLRKNRSLRNSFCGSENLSCGFGQTTPYFLPCSLYCIYKVLRINKEEKDAGQYPLPGDEDMLNQGIAQLIQMAGKGDGQACFDLYEEYLRGENVHKDLQTAQSYLEKAVDYNNSRAQLQMGLDLLNGGKMKEGLDYIQLSCLNQNVDAMELLGQLYLGNVENIENTAPDVKTGILFLEEAAMQGSVSAQVTLGKAFYLGKWVGRNPFYAELWLERAVENGSEEAQLLLDEMFRVQSAVC